MIAAALLLASLAAAAPEPAPPAATRLEAALSSSAAARRLLAAAGNVPRREARASALPFAVDERGGDAPEIVLDLTRLGRLPPGEAEAEYARALAGAAIAAPTPLVEVEQARWQWTAEILLQLAAGDAALSRALRDAGNRPAPGAPALNRAAAFLAQFELGPEHAYWLVESGADLPRDAARLTDVEDLFALRAAEIRAQKAPPDGPYGTLAGRRYPLTLARAAFRLRAPGALAGLREALDAYDTVGLAPLHDALVRWRRALPAR